MDKDKPAQYAIIVNAQVVRVEEGSFLTAGADRAVLLEGKFQQSYQLGEDTSDSNGRVRSRIGEDITHLLQRLTDEHKWRYSDAEESDSERSGETDVPSRYEWQSTQSGSQG